MNLRRYLRRIVAILLLLHGSVPSTSLAQSPERSAGAAFEIAKLVLYGMAQQKDFEAVKRRLGEIGFSLQDGKWVLSASDGRCEIYASPNEQRASLYFTPRQQTADLGASLGALVAKATSLSVEFGDTLVLTFPEYVQSAIGTHERLELRFALSNGAFIKSRLMIDWSTRGILAEPR